MPSKCAEIIKTVQNMNLDIPLGIHAHNDSDLAVANSLLAIEHNVCHVQGTINGYGERCGNANLCSVIANAGLKSSIDISPKLDLKSLTKISRYVSEIANLPHREEAPFVGNSAFAHKGGIHVSAILRNRKTYEHIEPELVGNHQRVLVSDQSGQSNVLVKAKEMGLDLSSNREEVLTIVQKLKELEHLGYQFEGADGSFEVLVQKSTATLKTFLHWILPV